MRIYITNGRCSLGRRIAGALLMRETIDLFCYDGIGRAHPHVSNPTVSLEDSVATFDADVIVDLRSFAAQETGTPDEGYGCHDAEKLINAIGVATRSNEQTKPIVINIASQDVFGEAVYQDRFSPVTEFAPSTRDAAFQAASVFLVEHLGRLKDVKVITLFIPTLFGDLDCIDKRFSTWADLLADGRELDLSHRSSEFGSYLHVDKAAQAVLKLMSMREHKARYALPGFERTHLEMARTIAWTLDVTRPDSRIGQRQNLILAKSHRYTAPHFRNTKHSPLLDDAALSPAAFHDDIREALTARLNMQEQMRKLARLEPLSDTIETDQSLSSSRATADVVDSSTVVSSPEITVDQSTASSGSSTQSPRSERSPKNQVRSKQTRSKQTRSKKTRAKKNRGRR